MKIEHSCVFLLNKIKKYFILFIIINCFFTSTYYIEAATTTTGFIPGQIWYSKDPFVEGDTIKIYTALWNNSSSSLSTKVEFYDKNVLLGSRDITVPPLNLQEVYVSWKVTSGDHSISAKIISPTVILSGKKESVSVNNRTTETDKRFVPIIVNTIDGKPATSTDIIKSQVDKATSSIGDILPESISTPAGDGVGAIDDFRVDTLKQLSEAKDLTEKKIDEIKKTENLNISDSNNTSNSKNTTSNNNPVKKVGIEDATEKPIAYLKLFFLSVLYFVFGSKIVFYLLIALIIFFILRFIYRKIRNK